MVIGMEQHRDTTIGRAPSELWLRGEPKLEELLQDPMLLLVLRRWNTSVDEIRRLVDRVENSPFH